MALGVLVGASSVWVYADTPGSASTKERLERAGVPAELRGRVEGALQRAGDWLAERQNADGSFTSAGDSTWLLGACRAGITPLCGLALEVAGRSAAAGRAARWMSPDGTEVRREIRGHVYANALALLLLREHGRDQGLVAGLAGDLVGMADTGTGFWAWRWTPPEVPFGTLVQPSAPPADIDATRFAVLGLAAAEAAGWRAPRDLWQRHLEGLLRSQDPTGAFAWGGPRTPAGGGMLQGIVCLVLGRDALRRRGPLPAATEERLEKSLAAARAALEKQAPDALWVIRKSDPSAWGNAARFDLACAFAAAGRPDFGGRDVYATLADELLSGQRRDGSWAGGAPPDDLVATSFAVLVLGRVFDGLRPEGPPAVRPTATLPVWPEPGAPPPSGRIPFAEAEEVLSYLEGLVEDPGTPPAALASALRLVGRCYGRLAPGPEGPIPEKAETAWHRRAEAAFLRALCFGRPDRETRRNAASDAARVAALLLGSTHPRVSAPMRRALEEGVFPGHAGDADPGTLRAAFASLARLGDPASAAWLAEEVLGTEASGPRGERSLEALGALPLFRDLPWGIRRDCMERILGLFEGLEAAAPLSPGDKGYAAGSRERWAAFRAPVLDALASLSTDPATGAPAVDAFGTPVSTVKGFREWLRRRGKGKDTPRRDR